ncbi:MAG: PD-(D/E)XK nuclease family protein, partial [Lachnospiraceae bacterium]|nr:PD-(D/E)XK nuclease family protein [Lachnospiraceae bacterium]
IVEKYHRYEEDPASPCRRIDLKENYRSRREVLEGANELFTALMSEAAGGVDYDEKASLKAAASYEGEGFEPRAVFIETDSAADEGAREQARYIAGEIHRLFEEGYQVYESREKTFRPLELRDIVILLRKKKRDRLLAQELESFGIPAVYNRKSGFFDRREVRQMLALLAVVDNPRQDIPLAALMLSPMGGFTEEDLARIKTRSEDPLGQELWDRLVQLQEEPKISLLLEQIRSWRRLADYRPLPELSQDLFELCGLETYLKVNPREGNPANIGELVQMARDFENSRSQGLFAFLRYLEEQKKLSLEDRGEAEQLVAGAQAVQIDSIHASKGLEFPVVFLTLCESNFDNRDSQGDCFSDEQEGIALQSVDLQQYVKTKNLAYLRVQDRVIREGLSEEIRLLYVAMTRARERFYFLGRGKDRIKESEKLQLLQPPEGRLPLSLVQGLKSYMQLYLAARVNEFLPHFPEEWIKTEDLPRADSRPWPSLFTLPEVPLGEASSQTRKQAEKAYPYQYPEKMKAAYSVSELVKKSGQEKEAEALRPAKRQVPDEAFEAVRSTLGELERLGAAERGSLYHRVMELIPWELGETEEAIRGFLTAAAGRGLLRPEDLRELNPALIASFFRQEEGRRSLRAFRAGKLWREQPFVIGVPYQEINPEYSGEERVLVQGIIDLFFEEEGQLILVDYKTDRQVTREQLRQRYAGQLDYYARALEMARNQPVKERYLYSFWLQCFVPV